ncbi:MAG: transposase, partial [Planctomycetaceae bacterium]|nr:transposase [Planctomycetaceae bacterium]
AFPRHGDRGVATSTPRVSSGTYRRREPETTVLHQVVRENLETFLDRGRSSDGEGYPRFIEQAFRKYLSCGLLCHGFARIRCGDCGAERLVAFSCKGKMCPSCQARRMSELSAYLRDQLLPEAPYRQWVLTVPWVLRYRLMVDRKLLSQVLRTFLRTVFAWQRRRGRKFGIERGETGSITFVHRFGGALNAHAHFHALIPDGLFVPSSDNDNDARLTFVELPIPTRSELEELTEKIARRVTKLVEKLSEEEFGQNLDETAASLQVALSKAMSAPTSVDQLSFVEQDHQGAANEGRSLCAKIAGFSLHAGQSARSDDRDGLERLCRYGLRAPFSQERLSLREDGQVV